MNRTASRAIATDFSGGALKKKAQLPQVFIVDDGAWPRGAARLVLTWEMDSWDASESQRTRRVIVFGLGVLLKALDLAHVLGKFHGS